ncbi:Cerato-platanin-domain-containing protein [Ganoderma leucocontextum]|nr:Cerato-platanin-domain-containing protein [Ganoderma leucocontextum]
MVSVPSFCLPGSAPMHITASTDSPLPPASRATNPLPRLQCVNLHPPSSCSRFIVAMRFSAFAPVATLLALPAARGQDMGTPVNVSVSFDQTYDNGNNSMEIVACSDGINGLITRNGWTTFSQASGFPNIGGSFAVAGFDSPNCGTCWQLFFAPTNQTLNVLAIDTAPGGFNIALEAMNVLTNNASVDLGRVEMTAVQVDATGCEQAGVKKLPPSVHG